MPIVQLAIPDEAPVMVLPNTLLFPHALMPLHIFEPRYRAMLQWALEHERVFCMALRKPASEETHSAADFFHTAGLGLVRACVGRDDGTSHLMLQGLARVRFAGFSQTHPFFIAKIEILSSSGVPKDERNPRYRKLLELAEDVRAVCRRFREVAAETAEEMDDFLEKVQDPELLADSVAHAFLRDPLRRQELMEEPDVHRRLTALVNYLGDELDPSK